MNEDNMNTQDIYASGVLDVGEEVSHCFPACQINNNGESTSGVLALTNQRFIFLRRPKGWNSKGFDLSIAIRWENVLSVSSSGLLFKRLNVKLRYGKVVETFQFSCQDKLEDVIQKISNCKNTYNEIAKTQNNNNNSTSVEASQVKIVVQESTKDNAIVILQKRLARGEITLEEFHRLVQRL
jgi:hypothetical protein